MRITLKRLPEIPSADIVDLMNHPSLRRHMPLLGGRFTEADCAEFIVAKEALWAEHGYGPWAFLADGKFVGWGGLQQEGGDADVALVLHPDHWGLGETIYRLIIADGFQRRGFKSVTALLPRSRVRERAMKRLGFVADGEVSLHGEKFLRYRLYAPDSAPVADGQK